MIRLDNTSEQSIITMLRDNNVLQPDQVKQIETLSKESGKSQLETAFELNITNDTKIAKLLSESFSIPLVNLDQIKISKEIGAETPFVRPKNLSTDKAKSIDVILHAVFELPGFDYVVLLQPTSPLRRTEHINSAFKKLFEENAPSCVSVCRSKEINELSYLSDTNGYLTPINSHNRKISVTKKNKFIKNINGAIYISKISWLKKYKSFKR